MKDIIWRKNFSPHSTNGQEGEHYRHFEGLNDLLKEDNDFEKCSWNCTDGIRV